MSVFWWLVGSIFIFLGIYYLFVAVDRHTAKRKLREGAILRTQNDINRPPHQQPNQTVIYTIPTTRQLAQQYPQMSVQHYPAQSQNQPPPYIDLPPTYDQVVVYPAPSNVTTATHATPGTIAQQSVTPTYAAGTATVS